MDIKKNDPLHEATSPDDEASQLPASRLVVLLRVTKIAIAIAGAAFALWEVFELTDENESPGINFFLEISIVSLVGPIAVWIVARKGEDLLHSIRDYQTRLIEANKRAESEIAQRKQTQQELESTVSDLQKALEEINTLSGLLPICAACKNVRDDNGYWNQIEVYIRDHADVEFSHSVCPDCMQELYPEFAKSKAT